MKPPRLENVKMRWSCNHYDGPIAGVAEHDGLPVWFEMLGGIYANRKQRAYMLYPLTADEFKIEDSRQQLFRDAVGMHCDYVYVDGHRRRCGGAIVPPCDVGVVYAAMSAIRGPYEVVYTKRKPIGYVVGFGALQQAE